MESLVSSAAAKKTRKSSSRRPKKTSATISHELASVALEGRYRRVRKACERCRMMKTKVYPGSSDKTFVSDPYSVMGNCLAKSVLMLIWSVCQAGGRLSSRGRLRHPLVAFVD